MLVATGTVTISEVAARKRGFDEASSGRDANTKPSAAAPSTPKMALTANANHLRRRRSGWSNEATPGKEMLTKAAHCQYGVLPCVAMTAPAMTSKQ